MSEEKQTGLLRDIPWNSISPEPRCAMNAINSSPSVYSTLERSSACARYKPASGGGGCQLAWTELSEVKCSRQSRASPSSPSKLPPSVRVSWDWGGGGTGASVAGGGCEPQEVRLTAGNLRHTLETMRESSIFWWSPNHVHSLPSIGPPGFRRLRNRVFSARTLQPND